MKRMYETGDCFRNENVQITETIVIHITCRRRLLFLKNYKVSDCLLDLNVDKFKQSKRAVSKPNTLSCGHNQD